MTRFVEDFRSWLEEELGGSDYELSMDTRLEDLALDELALLSLKEHFDIGRDISSKWTVADVRKAAKSSSSAEEAKSTKEISQEGKTCGLPARLVSKAEPKRGEIVHDETNKRFYYAYPDRQLAEVNYQMQGNNTVNFVRTFVPEAYRGQPPPMSQELPLAAYKWAAAKKYRISTSCWYLRDMFGPQHKSEFGHLYV